MIIPCSRCGAQCNVSISEDIINGYLERGEQFPFFCSHCFDASVREAEEKRESEAFDEEAYLDEAVLNAGVRPRYAVRHPIVPYVAEWLLSHLQGSVLLSGETGTGKSTSGGYLAREMLRKRNTVGVYYFAELVDKWREVRCDHDNPYDIKDFFRSLEEDDYIIIDECAGKTVNTDSSREFMYRFLEDINNRTCTSHVVLLGNFYTGSIADIFGDAAPSMRRIRENFVCGRIDPKHQRILPYN